MSTGPVELQGITINAGILETLQGFSTNRNVLKGITIAVGTGAQIMQLKVVDRNHEPIEGATCRVLNAVGGSNKVLSHDQVDDFTDVGDNNYDIATSYSLEAWIKTTTDGMIIGRDGSGAVRWWQFRVLSGKLHVVRFNSSGGVVANFAGSTNINTGEWVHVAMTFSTTNGTKLFVNGNLDGSNATLTANKTGTGEKILIGARRFSSRDTFFGGLISDVRIWETERTPTEISENKSIRLNGDETGLAGYWKLDEGTGTTATDLAGSNNGTIYGATWQEADESFPLFGPTGLYYTDVYDTGTTNANGLTTLNYQINRIHGLEVTLPGKRRFIMPFQRTTRGLFDWQVMLSDYLATFVTDRGNILINSEPENNDANFLIE
jgi:hypothetical protein